MERPIDEVSPRGGSFAKSLLMGGGLILAAVAIGKFVSKNRTQQQATAAADRDREKALKDTFPASDPPASQYFDIPANRQ